MSKRLDMRSSAVSPELSWSATRLESESEFKINNSLWANKTQSRTPRVLRTTPIHKTAAVINSIALRLLHTIIAVQYLPGSSNSSCVPKACHLLLLQISPRTEEAR